METVEYIIASIAIILLGVCALIFIEQYGALKQEAITRGYAEYNSTNGNWQWKSLPTTNSMVK